MATELRITFQRWCKRFWAVRQQASPSMRIRIVVYRNDVLITLLLSRLLSPPMSKLVKSFLAVPDDIAVNLFFTVTFESLTIDEPYLDHRPNEIQILETVGRKLFKLSTKSQSVDIFMSLRRWVISVERCRQPHREWCRYEIKRENEYENGVLYTLLSWSFVWCHGE